MAQPEFRSTTLCSHNLSIAPPSRSSSVSMATRYCSWENTQKSQGHRFVFMVQIPGLHSTGLDKADERLVSATTLQFHQKMSGSKRNEDCTSLITVFFTPFFYNDLGSCLHMYGKIGGVGGESALDTPKRWLLEIDGQLMGFNSLQSLELCAKGIMWGGWRDLWGL